MFFDIDQDEDQAIVLQTCKERIESLVRGHVGEIDSKQGQIRDDFFDTSKLPERIGRSL